MRMWWDFPNFKFNILSPFLPQIKIVRSSHPEVFWHKCFPVNFAKFLRTSYFYKRPSVAASELCKIENTSKDGFLCKLVSKWANFLKLAIDLLQQVLYLRMTFSLLAEINRNTRNLKKIMTNHTDSSLKNILFVKVGVNQSYPSCYFQEKQDWR